MQRPVGLPLPVAISAYLIASSVTPGTSERLTGASVAADDVGPISELGAESSSPAFPHAAATKASAAAPAKNRAQRVAACLPMVAPPSRHGARTPFRSLIQLW